MLACHVPHEFPATGAVDGELPEDPNLGGFHGLKARLANPSLTCSLRVSLSAECGHCGAALVGCSSTGFLSSTHAAELGHLSSALPDSPSQSSTLRSDIIPANPLSHERTNTAAVSPAPNPPLFGNPVVERPLAWFLEHRVQPNCSPSCACVATCTAVRSSPLSTPSSPPVTSTSPCLVVTPRALDSHRGADDQEGFHADHADREGHHAADADQDADVLMLLDDLVLPPAQEQTWTHCGYVSDSDEDLEGF